MPRKIRTLLFSSLYPNAARPVHGVFVETRLRDLLRTQPVESVVVAPVPWFPSTHERWGDYARWARAPMRERRSDIDVLHPRYLVIPKLGTAVAPLLLALSGLSAVRQLQREGFDFDLIDAHYFYPDGVAAALLSRWLGKPLVITARGSDINLIATHAVPRRWMLWAAGGAGAVIGVSAALVEAMRRLGMAPDKLHVVRNGVDLERFRPWPCDAARTELGIQGGPVLLSVGNLLDNKGHHLVIDALQQLTAEFPASRLIIVGEGPERAALEARVTERQLSERVDFTGALANDQLARWYSAADVLVLASGREGWPNVLLEAMACGTPVVATAVGGVPEIVQGSAGRIVATRTVGDLVSALREQLRSTPDRDAVRAHAMRFGWAASSEAQHTVFRRQLPVAGEPAHA